MSSTNSTDLEAAALRALIQERVKVVTAKAKMLDEARVCLPTGLHRLLAALRTSPYRGRSSYDTGNLEYLVDLEVDPVPEAGSDHWCVVFRIYAPSCKPSTWILGNSYQRLDKLVPPVLKLECNSNLPDGVHVSGTSVDKPFVVKTAEAAVDQVLSTLLLLGLTLCEENNEAST